MQMALIDAAKAAQTRQRNTQRRRTPGDPYGADPNTPPLSGASIRP
ncbi:hypothetical protein [Phytohabitans aurantiacus]|nr:hypothetical protein [Phytohabitans aurantiacus]